MEGMSTTATVRAIVTPSRLALPTSAERAEGEGAAQRSCVADGGLRRLKLGGTFPRCDCGEGEAPHPTLLTQGHLPPQRALRVGGKGKADMGTWLAKPSRYGDTKELLEMLPDPTLSSRTLAEPDRCKRSAARLASRDPERTGHGACNLSLGPGSNTRDQLLTQLSSCNGRDDRGGKSGSR
jgi:hypothetical protein